MKQASFPLWNGQTPHAKGNDSEDIPAVEVYLPEAAQKTDAAMVVLPGGGYSMRAEHEGKGYAEWLASNGIASFVVSYRLASHGYPLPVPFEDATRAVRWVRAHASEYGIALQKIGVIGSSAGGHLVGNLVTHFDAGNAASSDPVEQVSSRPDLGVLCYALTLMPKVYDWEFAFGAGYSDEQRRYFIPTEHVTRQTPPCFVWHTVEDEMVPVENSLRFSAALQRNHVSYELHLYQKGHHGIGLANGHPWSVECLRWLKQTFQV